MRRKFFLLIYCVFISKFTIALTGICPPPANILPGQREAMIAEGEMLTAAAISQAGTLSSLCVPPPVDPYRGAFCSAKFSEYTATVTKLSFPCTLEITTNPRYLAEPFTPCKYVAASIFYAPYCSGI